MIEHMNISALVCVSLLDTRALVMMLGALLISP